MVLASHSVYYDLVKLYKTITGICIHVHTHCNCTTVYIYSVALQFNQEFVLKDINTPSVLKTHHAVRLLLYY